MWDIIPYTSLNFNQKLHIGEIYIATPDDCRVIIGQLTKKKGGMRLLRKVFCINTMLGVNLNLGLYGDTGPW